MFGTTKPMQAVTNASRSEKVKEIKLWLRNYARSRLNCGLSDERRCIAPHVLLDFGRKGIMGLQDAPAIGGCGLSLTDSLRILRQIAAIDLSLANIVAMHNFLAGTVIRSYGSEAIKNEFVSDLASGRQLAAFALTERGAGSDPRRIASLAVRRTDGSWILNGSKIWSGLAAWSGLMVTFAQTQDETGKSTGITAFAVRQDAAGVSQGAECSSMGLRAVIQNEINFSNVELSDADRLGEVGRGLEAGQEAMMLCRLVMGVMSLGAMGRILQIAARYVSRRTISTGKMCENPVIVNNLAKEISRASAVETYIEFIYRQLDEMNHSDIAQELFLVCKIIAPESMWQTVDAAMQMLGGRGYLENNVVARFMRDGRVFRIFEGPTETLTAHLGARMWLRPEPLKELFCNKLKGEDIWRVLEEFKADKNRSAGKKTRLDLKIYQFELGSLAAHGLFYAVVRFQNKEVENFHAVKLARQAFDAAHRRILSEPSVMRNTQEVFAQIERINNEVGDVDEQNIAAFGGIDPMLIELPD